MITVYEIYGTSALLDINGHPILTVFNPADSYFQQNLNPTKFSWVNVVYPAAAVPMNQSTATGTTNLINAINATAGEFVLIGWSQGAIITSNVYDQLRSGSLVSRNADFLGGVTFGNPRRQAGHTFPGCREPGGNGIDYYDLLTNSEQKWWDFAIPGDTACCNNNTSAQGQWATAIYELINLGWKGDNKIVTQILSNPMWPITAAKTISYIFWDITSGPHGQYGTYQPLAPTDRRACPVIALDYINSLAQ